MALTEAEELIATRTYKQRSRLKTKSDTGALPPPVVRALHQGEIRKQMLAGELKAPSRLTSADLLPLIEERLWYVLQAMGQDFIAMATARDLTAMFNALSDKRNLLRGDPTQIVRSDTRGDLKNALALFLAEGQRRGITLDGEMKNITPHANEVRQPDGPLTDNERG